MSSVQRTLAHRSKQARFTIETLERRELLSISRTMSGQWSEHTHRDVEQPAEVGARNIEQARQSLAMPIVAPAAIRAGTSIVQHVDAPYGLVSQIAIPLYILRIPTDSVMLRASEPVPPATQTALTIVPLWQVQVIRATTYTDALPGTSSDVSGRATAESNGHVLRSADHDATSPIPMARPTRESNLAIPAALAGSAIPRTAFAHSSDPAQPFDRLPPATSGQTTQADSPRVFDHPEGGIVDLIRRDDAPRVEPTYQGHAFDSLFEPLIEGIAEDPPVIPPTDSDRPGRGIPTGASAESVDEPVDAGGNSPTGSAAERFAFHESPEGGLIDLAAEAATIAAAAQQQRPGSDITTQASAGTRLAHDAAISIEASLGIFRAFEIAGPTNEHTNWIDNDTPSRRAGRSTTPPPIAAIEWAPSSSIIGLDFDNYANYLRCLFVTLPVAVFAASVAVARRRQQAEAHRTHNGRIDPRLCDLLFARNTPLLLETLPWPSSLS